MAEAPLDLTKLDFKKYDMLDPRRYVPDVSDRVYEKVRSQLVFKAEIAINNGDIFLRDEKRKRIYRQNQDCEGYTCVSCTSEIQATGSTRSIHDGPFDGAGSGKVYREIIPYCPKCEEKPASSNAPIRIPWPDNLSSF